MIVTCDRGHEFETQFHPRMRQGDRCPAVDLYDMCGNHPCNLPLKFKFGVSKTTIHCNNCIDCQRMVGPGKRKGVVEVSWRCYGQTNGVELKRDIRVSRRPPRESPTWCPHRGKL